MNAQSYFDDFNKRVANLTNISFASSERLNDAANKIINNYSSMNDILDAFKVFAAFNYLNAKAKEDHNYYFKRKIENVVSFVLQKTDRIGFFLEKKTNTFLVNFYGFVFSFHMVKFSEQLAYKLLTSKPIHFDGVKKQPAASYILEEAIRMKNDSALNSTTEQTTSSSGYSNSMNFSYKEIHIDEIENRFHISKLCTTKETAINICVVISNCYFLKDVIVNGNLSEVLHKSNLRLLVTQIDSIVEAIELEMGAKLLNVVRNSRRHNKGLDNKCLKAFKRSVDLSNQNTKDTYKNLHSTRNNIHLSKYQPVIYKNSEFTNEKVETYFKFAMKYIEFIYDNFK